MRIRTVVITLILMSLLGACQPAEKPLRFVIIPTEEATQTVQQWQAVVAYLSNGLDQEVELLTASDFAAVVEAMKYGHADMAWFGPASYVIAVNEGADIEPIVAGIQTSSGLPGYYSVLVALTDTDVSDLSKLTFGFVDVSSTSGYIVPSVHLKKIGVEPKETLIAGTHGAVILAVKYRSVDVGAVAEHLVREAIKQGILSEDEFQVVWRSELIPECPIVVQSAMPRETKDKLIELFLNVPDDVVQEIMTASGFVRTDDAAYDPIREILEFKNR